MNIYLSHMTAVWFWRTVYPADRSPSEALWSADFKDACFSADDIWAMVPSWVTPEFCALVNGRIDVLVPLPEQRWQSATRESHLWSRALTEKSLHSAGHGVFMSSPEFTFLQMATLCTFPQLVAYGCELCGLYSFKPHTARGIRKRKEPLTTKQQLASYLENAAGAKGSSKAVKALRYVVEKSASPMETATVLLMSFPYRLGGYGIALPELNLQIELPVWAQAVVDKPYLIADYCWESVQLVVEYQGEHDHAGRKALNEDSGRLSVLRELGYDVELLAVEQVKSNAAFEIVVKRIARKTGKRIAKDKLGMINDRRALRKELFSWNASNGVPLRYRTPSA